MTTATPPTDTKVTVTPSGNWRGVLGLMDAWSADQRMLAAPQDGGAVRARPLPLPLLVQPELAPGHDGAKLGIGVIDRVWTENGMVMGEGRFDMDDPEAANLARKVGLGYIRFVSLDVDDATAQEVCLAPDGETIADECDPTDPSARFGQVFSGWRIMGATLLAHPAFPDAHIALSDTSGEETAQAAVSLAADGQEAPLADVAEIVGYDPAWGCVVPDDAGGWVHTEDCEAENAVPAAPTGDKPFDPEGLSLAVAEVPEEQVADEGNGCVAPDPGAEGAWVPAECGSEGAVPANADGTGPAEEVTEAASEEASLSFDVEGEPTHAGLAVKALDTGRVLMLQRSMADESDPAAGMWEFPGGAIEDGEDPQAAAFREFTEETGITLPDTVTVVNGWRSANGVYQGHVATVPTEAEVGLNPPSDERTVLNPDDPDGDLVEVAAWWALDHLPESPSLREEVREAPWDLLEEAGTEAAAQGEESTEVYAAVPVGEEGLADGAPGGEPGEPAADDGYGCVCPGDDDTYVPCDCTNPDAVTAGEDGQPVAANDEEGVEMGQVPADCKPCQAVAITASASTDTATAPGFTPPTEWFTQPRLTGPTPITVDAETGRLVGHLAAWGTCHVGFKDRCITPPRSASGYSFFHTARIPTSDGAIDCGLITMDTGHAPLEMTASSSVAHYDNTGSQAAVVRVGEDAYGIWVAGVTLPFVTQEQRLRLSLASFSGDWRHIRGGAELVAALAVNTPGFPMPARKTGSDNADYALVAAGALPAPRGEEAPVPDVREEFAQPVDPAAVAAIVIGELDARDRRGRQYAALTGRLQGFKEQDTARRVELAKAKIKNLQGDFPPVGRIPFDDREFAKNWVDQQGGLPPYIKRISKHLEEKGMGTSQAIATAVNVVKKMCSSGDTNWPGMQKVNAKSQAQACAAVAKWESMKAAAKAS